VAGLSRKHKKVLRSRGIEVPGSSYSDLKAMSDQAQSSDDLPLAEALKSASQALAPPDEQLDQILRELKDRGLGES
jgi:hypothetical protein